MYKVLVVEDEDIIRKGLILEVHWLSLECTVIGEARNGIEAIEMIRDLEPDIVILDINMPLKDGLQVLKETYEDLTFVSIILSGYSTFEYAQQAISYGVAGYLTKPIDFKILEQTIERAKQILNEKSILNKTIYDKNELLRKELINKREYDGFKENIVSEILDYIEQNYNQKIDMLSMSSTLHYSQTYLNRKFKSVMGTTFNNYLNKYRIHKAIEIIKQKEFTSIEDLAQQCGISNYKYFNVVFKKFLGVSVSEYISILK